MKQGLSLRVSQHLALTPQLQQSIRLLQLSTLELAQEVEQLLDENPFLERLDEDLAEASGVDAPPEPALLNGAGDAAASELAPATGATAGEADAGSADGIAAVDENIANGYDEDSALDLRADDGEWGGDAPARKNNLDDDEAPDATELARGHESLQQALHRQALSLRLGEEDRAALLYLIESLDDDGYLADPIDTLADALAGGDPQQTEDLTQRLSFALRLLQQLEPTGVGARHLAECLTLQLRALPAAPGRDAALAICAQPLELLARRDFKRLVALTGQPEPLLREATALIGRLEPKPGRRFIDTERNIVVPDVLVVKVGRQYRAVLNGDVMPKLRVHDVYAQALKQQRGSGAAGHAALQQRLAEARWFIKNIQQRFDTILRVSNAIVERQKNFFLHGELAMRPLVLREIADELGLHESTISRVTTAKYMATPFGTFELKYFFGSALGTQTGGNASSTAVRALIRQFVAAECSKKPLSDNQLSDMLREQGIECARRTVAKYREAMKIAPANLRKEL